MSQEILHDPEILTEKVPLPARDGPAVHRGEQAAEQRRQTAFDSVPHWQGQPLHPFSVSRETLFLQLRTAAGAPPLMAAMIDREAWYADAVRMLWLCSHLPDDWAQLRTEPVFLQSAIDQWADQHLHSGRHKTDLVLLTLKIWNDSQATAHVPAADPVGKDREPGN